MASPTPERFQARRLLYYLIILAIAAVFVVQFGPGSKGFEVTRTPTEAAATVNGKEIPLTDLARMYAQTRARIRSQPGAAELTEDILDQIVKPSQVLDQLVDAEVLAQAAERDGIVASDEELRQILHHNPDFQKEGKFDYEHYQNVVKQYYRELPVPYETNLRRRLSAQKLLNLVKAGAVVSDDEVRARFRKEADKTRLEVVRFLPAMYSASAKKMSPADIQAYAKAHAPQIAQEYQTNRFAYRKPEQVRVRQIVLKPGPQAKDRAAQIQKEINGGKDFIAAVKEYSEDAASKATGGDLGFKSREDSGWQPAFARVAFTLEPGKVSDPIETPTGVYLVKVEDKRPFQEQPLEAVNLQIAEQLAKKEKAKTAAKSAVDAALAKLKSGKKLADLFPAGAEKTLSFATETKPEVIDTGAFSLSEPVIPKVGSAPELQNALKTVTAPGPLTQVFAAGDGFVLAEVTERKRADEADYKAQHDQLYEEALQGKRIELEGSFIKASKQGASIIKNDQAIQSLATRG